MHFELKVYIIILLFGKILGAAQTLCRTPTGLNGECISIKTCKPLLQMITNKNRTESDEQFLRNSSCGYEDRSPLVCCELTLTSEVPPNKVLSYRSEFNSELDRKCITPDAKEGICIGVRNCSSVMILLQSSYSNYTRTYVRNLRCNGPDQDSICCTDFDTKVPKVPSNNCISTSEPPKPSTGCCGQDYSDRIYGGTATDIDQYPWLALIEYKEVGGNETNPLCGGMLISGRYVLTAGHCVKGKILKRQTPETVRLGEYDTSNNGIDCVVSNGKNDCNEGAVIIPINKIIAHEGYEPDSRLLKHDIALLRLQELAPYTGFIQPICLPTVDIIESTDNLTLYSAGWGAISEFQSRSTIKLHVDLPYVPLEKCQTAYRKLNIILWENHICAGAVKNKDTCKGDSGGPLMYTNGQMYDAVGVVSFGPTPCGVKGIPGVFTKVYSYLQWIRSHIEP